MLKQGKNMGKLLRMDITPSQTQDIVKFSTKTDVLVMLSVGRWKGQFTRKKS